MRSRHLVGHVRQFPQCWDGVNLDSPDHKSHMAYPERQLPGIAPGRPRPRSPSGPLYTVPAGGIPDGLAAVAGQLPYNGSNAGYSGHADW